MDIAVFVIPLILVGVIAWFSWRAKLRRREELARTAASLGMQYATEDPFNLVDLPFQLFGKGDGRGTENVLWGAWQGLDLKCFDYWYYTESTDSKGHRTRSYSRFSCSLTELDVGGAPVTITPETFFSRIADHIGFQDISFESEDFNRTFQVKCDDAKFATDLVDARMMQWLLADPGWSFELSGRTLLCYCGRVRPAELIPVMGRLKEFHEHVPRVVHELYPAAPATGDASG
jgi:hypothetical protein